MTAAPPITVITTTYNWPDALRVAIRSALAQTLTDFEYLVVGDACTDHSADLVASFADPRIRWINLAENRGNQADVNRIALEQARGEHIAYLNHDDIWFPEHLQTLHDAITGQGLDLVSSLALSIAPPGQHHREIIGLPRLQEKRQLAANPMTTNVMHSAEAARQCGGWENWRETGKIPTQDFFRRLRILRQRHAVVALITSLKFHSGDRRNSYARGSAREQQDWYARMRTDPDLRHREMALAMTCTSLGERPAKLEHPPRPDNAPDGWQIEQWRRMRGLAPMLDLGKSEPAPSNAGLKPPRNSLIKARSDGAAIIASPRRVAARTGAPKPA